MACCVLACALWAAGVRLDCLGHGISHECERIEYESDADSVG